MKKILLALCLLATLTAANAQKNVIKTNPFGFASGIGILSYERVITPKSSIEIGVLFYKNNPFSSYSSFFVENEELMNIGAQARYKLYFSKKQESPRGWYASPLLSYAGSSKTSTAGEDYKFSVFSGGVFAGYQYIFGRGGPGFSLDLFGGLQYDSISEDLGSMDSRTYAGLDFRIGFTFGYGF